MTIAAVLLVGCEANSKYLGSYMFESSSDRKHWDTYELKEDGTFIFYPPKILLKGKNEVSSHQGTWKIENDFLIVKIVIPGHDLYHSRYFNKNTLKHVFDTRHFYNDEGTITESDIIEVEDAFLVRVEDLDNIRDEKLDKILLTQCKACKGKVSTDAKTCPHCGQPDPVVKP